MTNFTRTLMLAIMGLLTIQATYAAKRPVKVLFVQMAEQATITPNDKNATSFTLVLKKPNARVTYFSDRPIRKVGRTSVEAFVKLWNARSKDSFSRVPPNVAVVSSIADFVAVLTNPVFDAKAQTITYQMQLLESESLEAQTLELTNVRLFIDGLGVHFNPGGF